MITGGDGAFIYGRNSCTFPTGVEHGEVSRKHVISGHK